jgi:site-specific recombinase XerD
VIRAKKGAKLNKGYLRLQLKDIARIAGIKGFSRIHDLCHTFASFLAMRGVDVGSLQKLMGHSDIQTTMIYMHFAPDHLRDAINKLYS